MKQIYLEAGEIVSTHGIRGEVKLLPWADGPEFLTHFKRIFINGVEYVLESCRIQKTCNLLKLRGIDTVEDGQKLIHATAKVLRCDVTLPEGVAFIAEILALPVFCDGQEIGKITDVLTMPANDVYEVTGKKTYMIPAVKAFVKELNVEEGRVEVNLIEGMEVDAH